MRFSPYLYYFVLLLFGNGARGLLVQNEEEISDPLFLGNYEIEDSCQYVLCGSEHLNEFGESRLPPNSCAYKCNDLAQKLVASRFKKEFLWGKCVEMCEEKYPRDQIRVSDLERSRNPRQHSSSFNSTQLTKRSNYQDRFVCMEDCFISYERVKPHHKIARACIHAACSSSARGDRSSLECFDRCAHHVSVRVPQNNWPLWSELLSTSSCPPKANQIMLDRLECTDRNLWKILTNDVSVSPDVLLLCLNGLCDHDLKCATACLGHVTSDVDPDDLPDWSRCTYSTVCAKISNYEHRVRCSDRCLNEYKAEQRRLNERQRIEAESQRKKEEEARALSAAATSSSSSYSITDDARSFKRISFCLILFSASRSLSSS